MRDVDRLRAALLAANAKELERITRAFYTTVFQSTNGDREALLALLEQEGITRTKVERSAVFKRLVKNTDAALADYSSYLLVELGSVIQTNIERGLKDGNLMIDAVAKVIRAELSPRRVPVDAVVQALNLLRQDGELYARLKAYPGYHAAEIAQSILQGVAEGRNPRVVAAELQRLYGVPLNDALRITRTSQIYSYRRAAHVDYAANSDVVTGWTWYARLDGDTCMSCVSMHGTIHSHNEELNDHHQGRCTPVPVLFGFNPVAETGTQWFEAQDEAMQRSMMGNAKHDAWQEGKITIDQLSTIKPDEVYGEMRIEPSLQSLIG